MSQYRLGVLGGMGPRVVASSISFVLPGRQNSFIPLLLLSKWNPLLSRWRLCRLADMAYPLEALRWASIWGLRPMLL